jgi:hypothetical protein
MPTPPSKPNSWVWQQDDIGGVVTPTIFEAKQNMLNNIPIYEHVNEEMALEESILDFQEVSNHDLKLTTNYGTKLNLQQVEESGQRYTRDFCHHRQGTTMKSLYLFALDHFCYLTISLKEYQPLGAGWGLQIQEQQRVTAVQEEKCLKRETGENKFWPT